MRAATQIYESFRVAIHTHHIAILHFAGIRTVSGTSCHTFNNLALVRLVDEKLQCVGRRHFAANKGLTCLDNFAHLRVNL